MHTSKYGNSIFLYSLGVAEFSLPFLTFSAPQSLSLPSQSCLPVISTQGIILWGNKLSSTWQNKKKKKKCTPAMLSPCLRSFSTAALGDLRSLAVTETHENIFTSCVNNSPSSPRRSLRVLENWYSVTSWSIKPEPPVAPHSVTF